MMTNKIAKTETAAIDQSVYEKVLVDGDLSGLHPKERERYYVMVCESVGLNPLTKPFNYITLQGKMQLYATKNCTDQMRSLRDVSLLIVSREEVEDVYTVIVRATLPNGRTDEDEGSVYLGGLKGEARANAKMKTVTKAKRRVTLSVCGLSFLDETEIDTIPGARIVEVVDQKEKYFAQKAEDLEKKFEREKSKAAPVTKDDAPVVALKDDKENPKRWRKGDLLSRLSLSDLIAYSSWLDTFNEPYLSRYSGHIAQCKNLIADAKQDVVPRKDDEDFDADAYEEFCTEPSDLKPSTHALGTQNTLFAQTIADKYTKGI